MLHDVALEALHYLDRTALEGLQMHSRYLRDLVNRHGRSLPLRYIHKVDIVFGNVFFEPMVNQPPLFSGPTSTDEEDLEVFFNRVNNAFIHRLELSFVKENAQYLQHLRTKANGLQCQLRALNIRGPEVEIDYALLDFVGVHLKPQIYETSANFKEYAMLFEHHALLGSVTHLVYELGGSPAPDCVIPALFEVDVMETCSIITEIEPRPWISNFIRKFEMAERGTDIVRSVTVLHTTRFRGPAPMRDAVCPFGQPRRAGVPAPHSAFVQEWSREARVANGITTTESTVAELFEFENAQSSTKLEVFAWSVEQVKDDWAGRHYAFLLQVVDT